MDMVQIYTYCSGDDAYDDVSKHLDKMVEERRNSLDAENLHSKLLEVHSNMRSWVNYKLNNVLALLIKIPAPTKYHYWFALFLDPRYFINLKDIKTFRQSANVDTKVLAKKMTP